jgi:hypothetical protein
MRQRNQAPMDDFHGLSPDQMHRILHFPFDSPNLVTYAQVVAGDPSAPILTLFGLLAEAIGEQGLKPTAEGRHDRHWRVKKRRLLTEAVRFHIPK